MHVGTAARPGAGLPRKPSLFGFLVAAALVLGGCSTVPPNDGDVQVRDAAPESDVKVAGGERVEVAANGERTRPSYPNLGEVPDRPKELTSTRAREEREALREGLVADTERARYSDEALRARTAAMSQPPVSFEPSAQAQEFARSPERLVGSAQALGESTPVAAPVPAVTAEPAAPPTPTTPEVSVPRVQPPAPATDAAVAAVAPTAPPSVPASPPAAPRAGSVPKVTPPPMPGQTEPPAEAPQSEAPRKSPPQDRQTAGAPQEALVPPRPAPSAAPQPTPGADSMTQIATIYFGNGSSSLGDGDRALVSQLAEAVMQKGGRLRIVGHASMGGTAGDTERRRRVNYEMSLKRANAVAEELIRLGVPRDRLVVAAEGDRQPIYAETAPTGAAGNRRTEIFLLDAPRT